MIQADPYHLRYSATRFAAGGQEFFERATRLQRIAAEVLQGNHKWSGQGAVAFARVIDHLHHDLVTASQAFERAAHALQSFAGQMEQVNQLREELRHIEQAIWSSFAMSPEEEQRLWELRRRAQDLSYQADAQARAADGQAASVFHEIATLEQSLFVKAAPVAATPHQEQSTFWYWFKKSMEQQFGGYYHFGKGFVEAVWETVEGIGHLVAHPLETLDNLETAVEHPIQTVEAIGTAIKDSFEKDVIHGDANSANEWFGHAIGEIATAVVGTKGVDKVADLLKGAAAAKTAAETAATVTEDVAKIAGENGNVEALYAESMETRATSGYLAAGRISSESLSFDSQLETLLGRYGMSKEEFNLLKNKQLDAPGTLTAEERQTLIEIRNSVELAPDTIMQKAVHMNELQKYFNGEYRNRIGGFVARAQDVVDLRDPLEIKNELRLDYNSPKHPYPENYNPERPNPFLDGNGDFIEEPVALIRFKATSPNLYNVPFEFDNVESLKRFHPMTGSGFLGGTKTIPEFTMSRIPIPLGTEVFVKNLDGSERLLARYMGNGVWEQY